MLILFLKDLILLSKNALKIGLDLTLKFCARNAKLLKNENSGVSLFMLILVHYCHSAG